MAWLRYGLYKLAADPAKCLLIESWVPAFAGMSGVGECPSNFVDGRSGEWALGPDLRVA